MSDQFDQFGYEAEVDPDAWKQAATEIAEQAAERGAQNALGYVAAQQQQQQDAAMQQLASASAAQADAELQKRYPGGEWDHDKAEVARRIGNKPGLIAETSYFNPAALANDLDTAYRVAQAETKLEAERKAEADRNEFGDNLVKLHRKSYAAHRESIRDVLKGDE